MRTTFFVLIILFIPLFGNITYCQKASTIISSPEEANRERIKRTKVWKYRISKAVSEYYNKNPSKHSGKNNPRYGKVVNKKTREKIRKSLLLYYKRRKKKVSGLFSLSFQVSPRMLCPI